MSNAAEFDKIMKDFYRSKGERVEAENKMLWDANIAMISALSDVPVVHKDWIDKARSVAGEQANKLRAWLEERRCS